jgi:hypothetical protein
VLVSARKTKKAGRGIVPRKWRPRRQMQTSPKPTSPRYNWLVVGSMEKRYGLRKPRDTSRRVGEGLPGAQASSCASVAYMTLPLFELSD